MRNLSLVAAVLAACLVYTTDTFAQVFGTDPSTGYDALRNDIRRKTETTVIVRLDVDRYVPEGRLPTRASRLEQRARIKTLQDRVLAAAPAGHVRVKRQYAFLPYLALVVDQVGLDAVSHIPGVELIQPDLTSRPALAESRLVIGADVANAEGCDGTDWAVAVLDTGVDLNNDAFPSGKIVAQACYSTNDAAANQESMCPGGVTESTAPGSADDCQAGEYPGLICPHGSLVAGVAVGNDPTGIVGIAPEADLVAVRFVTHYTDPADCPYGVGGAYDPGGCPLGNMSDLIAGIEHVAALSDSIKIAAINLSADFARITGAYNAVCDTVSVLQGIKDAVDLTNSLGIPSVAATGNGGDIHHIDPPSCLSNVISVSSTQDGSTYNLMSTKVDSVSHFANRAPILDFWAPGEWITSSFPDNTTSTVRGTSVAAPHVAGALAALRSKGTASDPDYYVNLLKTTGVSVTDVPPGSGITKPRIDLGAACTALSAISLNAKVLLEGPYAGSGTMSVPSTYSDSVPLAQPFADAGFASTPISYSGAQSVISLPTSTIDWVLVELRTSTDPASIVAQQPAFLTADGSVVDRYGGPVGFLGVDSTSYYVVIRHRNHAAVMSSSAVDFSSGSGSWDFTTGMSQAYGTSPMKDLSDGKYAMYGGESSLDGQLTVLDFTQWLGETTSGAVGYQPGDYNLDGMVTVLDFTIWLANTTAGAKSGVPD